MNVTARDRKIVFVLVPLVVLLGYWFMLLAPARKEAKSAGDGLAKQESRLADARAHEQGLASAKSSFASDYTQLVRLGKAVPSSLDMPSLIVQLDSAAQGTGIQFTRIATGDRTAAGTSSASAGGSAASSGSGSNGSSAPAGAASQAGGPKAQTGLGKATEKAHENANATSQKSTADANASATNTSTSTQSGKGGLPVGGGSGAAGQPNAGGTQVAGLDSVPLELTFEGNFFNLADFFHRMKRFVHVFNSQVVVRGRLMTVEGLKFSSDTQIFPRLKAELTATIYLSPKTQAATAGGSPQGASPSGTQSAATSPGAGSSGSGTAPTAVAATGRP